MHNDLRKGHSASPGHTYCSPRRTLVFNNKNTGSHFEKQVSYFKVVRVKIPETQALLKESQILS
ncbi:hypothetical protein GDO81_005552 [Engystomops pustulosus]|uniref:Uncharacterized protein n=1 Tax=Engystomops pustulosus TaxID=76066 RepID=A0AAV7CQR6_ENGPU|nr:hypothetical protein GDO81_005552 [Engystomops pustulosus]